MRSLLHFSFLGIGGAVVMDSDAFTELRVDVLLQGRRISRPTSHVMPYGRRVDLPNCVLSSLDT